MNALQIFSYQDVQVRTVIRDGEPWFVAADVCCVLGIGNSRMATDRLDDDEKDDVSITDAIGRSQNATAITESGLYSLILTSRKPEAKQFKKWVTAEVLPAIRKTGSYSMAVPQTLPEALRLAADLAEKVEQQEKVLIEMKPKADFFDAVTDSKDAVDIGTVAKTLNMGIGRGRLFEFLRAENILMANNQPYQKYIDAGYFRVIEQKYTKPDGSTCVNFKTVVYQKGINYIRQRLGQKSTKKAA